METEAPSGFSEFLQAHRAEILAEWESEVRKLPVAKSLSQEALLDHVPRLLKQISRIADELSSGGTAKVTEGDAERHASARLDEGFDLPQVVEEFAALRSCILRKWSAEHRGNTGPMAMEILNGAIDRAIGASVERYTQASDRTLKALDRISVAAFESRDLDDLLGRLLQTFLETTAAVDTAILMLRDGDHLVTRASVGLEEEVAAGFSMKIGEGFAGRVAAEKKPGFLRDAANDSVLRSNFIRARGVRALYAIPLLAGDELIGVAKMGSLTAYEFSEQDRRLFNVLGGRATAAIYQQLLQRTLVQSEKQRTAEQNRVRAILMSAPAAIAMIRGPDHVYEFSNPLNNQYLGMDPTGKSVAEAIPAAKELGYVAILDRVYETGEPFFGNEMPMRIGFGNEGPTLYINFVYQPVFGDDGKPDGIALFAFDVSDLVLARQKAEAISAEHERSRDQLRVILQGVSEGIMAIDKDHKVLFANDEAVRTSGFETFAEMASAAPGELRNVVQREDGTALPPEEFPIAKAFASRNPQRATLRSRPRSGGDETWWDVSATPVPSGDGDVQMVIAIWHDITGARIEERRQKFLADATAMLSESLDLDETLRKIAELSVPAIADWCAIDLTTEEKAPRRVAIVHADPKKIELAEAMRKRYPPDWDAAHGVANVLRTGRAELYEEIPDAMLVRSTRDAEHLRLVRDLGMRSAMCVPMISRGRIIGALTFVTEKGSRRYGTADLALAEELARRAAVAVDNATLYAEANSANQKKDEFLAMLAHELRNPLGPMMNAAALLRAGAPSKRPVEVLDRQVRHMSRMVDDLLEVSRISRGKIDLQREVLDVAEILQEVCADRAETVREAGLALSLETPAERVHVSADRTRLAQAVTNVVANAIKFSEPGGKIRVRLSAAAGRARISVIDQGIGIDADTLRSLFEAFTQADRSLDRSRGGLGLGLAIVRGLVELHGGKVEAASEGPGKGAEITLELPLATPERARREKPAADTNVTSRRILVVEDNRDAAEMMKDVLEHAGHVVALCFTGEAALEEARRFRPDVVLCDLGLPRRDGFSVARELRRDPALAGVRLIAIYGDGTESDRARSRQSGFDAHLTKPVDPATLADVLAPPES